MLVERLGGITDETVDTIMVPTAGGPHAELATEIGGAVTHPQDAAVRVVHVISPNAGEKKRAAGEELLLRARERVGERVEVETELLKGDDVVGRLVEEAEYHDLTIIGAAREGLLQQLMFGAIPEEVGRRTDSTVIMTKRQLDITSAFRNRGVFRKLWDWREGCARTSE